MSLVTLVRTKGKSTLKAETLPLTYQVCSLPDGFSVGDRRKAKETWTEEQRQGIEENMQKKDYQLVKELTSSKQGRTTTIQDKAGKCLTEEQDILKRWT